MQVQTANAKRHGRLVTRTSWMICICAGVLSLLTAAGLQRVIVRSSTLHVDRSCPFDPEEFFGSSVGKDLTLVQEISPLPTEIDTNGIQLENFVAFSSDNAREQNCPSVKLDARTLQAFLEHPRSIPEGWKKFPYVIFMGTVFQHRLKDFEGKEVFKVLSLSWNRENDRWDWCHHRIKFDAGQTTLTRQ